MKVEVDLDVCESQGVCIGLAPQVFDFDADDNLTILEPQPGEDLREAVEEAAAPAR